MGSDSKLVYEGNHLHFLVHKTGWEFVRRTKASQGITIVAATDKEKIVLIEQFRVPIGKIVIELPAGLVGDTNSDEQDNPINAARRELEEETGYKCGEIIEVCSGSLLPGMTNEINTLCLVTGLTSNVSIDDKRKDEVYEHEKKYGVVDEGEEIRVYNVPLSGIEKWLNQQIQVGKIIDLKVYLGIFYLRTILNA